MYDHRDRCAIAGFGQTDYTTNSGRSTLTLATQASLAAIADAGLRPIDIDGIIRCDMDDVRTADLIHTLGLHDVSYLGENGPGGAAPSAMVGQGSPSSTRCRTRALGSCSSCCTLPAR